MTRWCSAAGRIPIGKKIFSYGSALSRPRTTSSSIDDPGSLFPEEALREKIADRALIRPLNNDVLVGILSKQFPAREGGESFSGRIDGVDLLSYVQMILLSGTTTVLEIYSREGGLGTVYINEGRICHATSGSLQGEEALYHCLCFRGGSVLTKRWSEPEKITIDKPGDFLLVEAARLRDDTLAKAADPVSD